MPKLNLSKTALIILLGIAAVCIVLIFMRVLKPGEGFVSLESKTRQSPPEGPNPIHLSTVSAPDVIRKQLLDGDFKIVNRVEEISENCASVFESSFVSASGAVPKRREVKLANPGQVFQSSDALVPGAPFRRLEFAGLGVKGCFVYYQSGGKMYPSFCAAVIDYKEMKAVWIGESRKRAMTLQELRSMVVKGQFRDTGEPAC